ncbi:MAG: GNAT family N-acetyltransferase [Acidobacteriota bacterium]
MIRTATPADLPALRALFARANDEPYDLAAVAEEKCFAEGVAGGPVVRFAGEGQGAVVTCGKYVRILVVDRDSRQRGIGTALLADAEARGARVIAAEPGNYFTPGISNQSTQAFFRSRGYEEKAATWNLSVNLLDVPGLRVFETSSRPGVESSGRRVVESSSRRGVVSATEAVVPLEDLKTRRLEDSTGRLEDSTGTPRIHRPSNAEAPRVLAFIEREFGRIWRFEAAKAFDTEVPQIFVAEEEDQVTGFAAHDVNNRGLGFFGPTGVAKAMRGRGLGCRLLLASLGDLRRLGFERAVIPWTDALAFYRKCSGAEPAHPFIAFEKPQP